MRDKLVIQYEQRLGETQFNIDVVLPNKGITAIFGRSGAGKTSLINVIAGLTTPKSGTVDIDGNVLFDSRSNINLPTHKRDVGYVFQESRLFPHFSVRTNLNYGVKKTDNEHFERVTQLLALEHLLDRYPSALSGGEKQRVAIGRALLSKPQLLLMDEPLASLDLPRKREVMPFLEELAEKVEIPILYVTHSLNEILRLANHLVIIDRGSVINSGPIEEVWSSQAMRPWQSFSERSSLFEASVEEHNDNYALSKLKLTEGVSLWVQKVDSDIGTPMRLQVRANDVSITLDKPQHTSIRNILAARIRHIETQHQTDDKQSATIELQLADDCVLAATITVWALEELGLQVGSQVYAQVKGVSVTQRDIAVSH
ncbi:molybdenum ABC transporter ATP-binding protein ModC [Vibrio sp. T187]|uniref:molybdenum ABC transporter ATP-binding protein ModC n=1 Tax=Vibrio TaxID=662 RepID=UPI0010C964C6|nr:MULTISPECIES: molybdenum ABC transporter ATP-binding protein ModC [Vibrio]MBW3698073.1 molybdenum ABC transporter ATP-binding protein ModC [Vibrio sp. T187]